MSRTFDIILGTVGSLVAAALVGAGLFLAIKRSYSPGRIVLKIGFTLPFVVVCIYAAGRMGPFGPFLIVIMGVILSFLWTPHLAEMLCSPLTNLLDGGNVPPEQKPYYSIATAKRKLGQYPEAIAAVREQL